MKWTNKGHELDHLPKINGTIVPPVYLWGAGQRGKNFLETFVDGFHVAGFIDIDVEKQRDGFCGLPVYPPSHLNPETDHVVVTPKNPGAIAEVETYLEQRGFKFGETYFPLELAASQRFMYHMYRCWEEERLRFIQFNLTVTDICPLNCKHCIALVPYNRKKVHRPKELMFSDIDHLFTWADHVGNLQITGGDPLLHPDIQEILTYTMEHYGDKIRNAQIWTTAGVMPKDELLIQMRELGANFHISDYGELCKDRQKIEKFQEKCEKFQVPVEVVLLPNWFDFGITLKKQSIPPEKMNRFFMNCPNRRYCNNIKDGKLHYCERSTRTTLSVEAPLCPGDYFDLTDYRPERKRELIEFLLGYCDGEYPSYCYYCNGGFSGNLKVIPVGAQV